MYDSYISLGDNCESGLQFRRIGYEDSSFFRFTRYFSFSTLVKIINNDFKDIYLKNNLIPTTDNMVKDRFYNIIFHSRLKSHINKQNQRVFNSNYDFDEIYNVELSKIYYLADKFRQIASSKKRCLYFLKSDYFDLTINDLESLIGIILDKYPNHLFDILYLTTKKKNYRKLSEAHELSPLKDRIIIKYFSKFAPYDSALQSDRSAWNKIFVNFPLKKLKVTALSYPSRKKERLILLECVDFPKRDLQISANRFRIRGWVIGISTPITAIKILLIPDRVIKIFSLSVKRQDVLDKYIEKAYVQSTTGYLGFDTVIDLNDNNLDEMSLQLVALFDNGTEEIFSNILLESV